MCCSSVCLKSMAGVFSLWQLNRQCSPSPLAPLMSLPMVPIPEALEVALPRPDLHSWDQSPFMAGGPSDLAGPAGRPAEPLTQPDRVSSPVPPWVAHSRASHVHKAVYSWPITQKQLELVPLSRDPQQRLCAFAVPVWKSLTSPPGVFSSCHPPCVRAPSWCHPTSSSFLLISSCCVSQCPSASSTFVPFVIPKLAVHSLLSLSGLPPRAQSAFPSAGLASQCSFYSSLIANSSSCNGGNTFKCQIH